MVGFFGLKCKSKFQTEEREKELEISHTEEHRIGRKQTGKQMENRLGGQKQRFPGEREALWFE